MEQNALRAAINLVEDSQLVNLSKLVLLINVRIAMVLTQKSKLIQKLFLQPVSLQESYTALVDMGMIWRMATPSPEDCRMELHTSSRIIFTR